MLNEVKFIRLRQVNPEEILREAQNDRCLQFVVQYSRASLSLYSLVAIALKGNLVGNRTYIALTTDN